MVPLLVVGAAMMAAPAYITLLTNRTVYAVSDEQIFIVTALWHTHSTAYPLTSITSLASTGRTDNYGDVTVTFNQVVAAKDILVILFIDQPRELITLIEQLRSRQNASSRKANQS